MKDKGFILLAIVGVGFLFFVFNVVGNVENETLSKTDSFSSSSLDDESQKRILQYYKQDVGGTQILDLSGVPLETAKKIWRESPTKRRILTLFPNFNLMKDMIKLRVAPSEFRDYLLKRVDEIQDDYISGNITAYKAKEEISNLK